MNCALLTKEEKTKEIDKSNHPVLEKFSQRRECRFIIYYTPWHPMIHRTRTKEWRLYRGRIKLEKQRNGQTMRNINNKIAYPLVSRRFSSTAWIANFLELVSGFMHCTGS